MNIKVDDEYKQKGDTTVKNNPSTGTRQFMGGPRRRDVNVEQGGGREGGGRPNT